MNPNAAAFAFILQQRRDLSANQSVGNANTKQQSNQCFENPNRPIISTNAPFSQNSQYPAGAYQQQSYNNPQEIQTNGCGINNYLYNRQVPNYSQPVVQHSVSQYGWQPHHQQQSWEQQQQQLPPTYQGAAYGSVSYSASPSSSSQRGGFNGNNYPSSNNYSNGQQQYQYQSQPLFGVTNNIASTLNGITGSSAHLVTKNNNSTPANPKLMGGIKSTDSSIPHSSYSSSQPLSEPAQIFYCEGCDKEFTQQTAYNAHCANHETCRHPGCNFSGTKKVVIAHFHGSHGLYSGEGYKMIEVEGTTKKFRVLLGVSPEEIKKWRNDRKKNFPTAENTKKKIEIKEELRKAGGLMIENGRKRKRDEGVRTSKDSINSEDHERNIQGIHAIDSDGVDNIKGGEGKGKGKGEASKDGTTEGEDKGNSKPRKRPCVFFVKGTCKQGESCTYSHDFEVKICNFFVKSGRCTRGNRCTFAHDKDERMKFLEERKKSVDRSSSGGSKDKDEDIDEVKSSTMAPNGGERKRRKSKVMNEVCAKEDMNDDDLRAKAQKKKGLLYLPKPYSGGNRGTLLRNLLLHEVQEEENILLQCLRLIVRNNYLQPGNLSEVSSV